MDGDPASVEPNHHSFFFLMECLIHKSLAITVPSGEVDLTNTKPYITAPTDSVASIKRASHTAF